MTTDTLVGGILTSPCGRVAPAILVGGVVGPSSRSMASSSALRRAKKEKKKRSRKSCLFLLQNFHFFKNVSPKKKIDRCC